VVIGTLAAAIATATRSGAALFPVVSIPLVIFAVILPAVTATRSAINGDQSGLLTQLQPLVGVVILFAAAGYLLIDYVLEV